MARIVTDYLDDTSRRFPDKTALADEKIMMSFSDLRDKAISVATFLDKRGVFKKPIAIFMNKGVEPIVSFLGCAYSGNYYSPIDPSMPVQRINNILATLNPVYIITNRELETIAREFRVQSDIILFEDMLDDKDEGLVTELSKSIVDTDILYVFFTSGSTGIPKGVIISHRAVVDYTIWVNETFGLDETYIIGNQAPLYFDNSILDLYQCLSTGAEMCIIPPNLFSNADKLMNYISCKKINFLFWVPSALCIVANSGVLSEYKSIELKKVLFCGEVMPNKQLNIWRQVFPRTQFANLYGPTEITDACTYYIVDRQFKDDESLPIGRACKNTDVIVLDENNRQVSSEDEETIGELCVRGTCLSYGYFNDLDRTNEAFVQNPLNSSYREMIYRTGDLVKFNHFGELLYLGRKDFQIKISGYRIELGEIEMAMSSVRGILSNCCLFDEAKQQILCIYNGDAKKEDIREMLRKLLPRYMMPHKFKKIDSMPLNANGKIDRLLLKKLFIDKVEAVNV